MVNFKKERRGERIKYHIMGSFLSGYFFHSHTPANDWCYLFSRIDRPRIQTIEKTQSKRPITEIRIFL